MAIAGSTLEAFFIRMDGDGYRELGTHRPAKHLVVADPAVAIRRLRQHGSVYLWKCGDNLAKFRRLMSEGTKNNE